MSRDPSRVMFDSVAGLPWQPSFPEPATPTSPFGRLVEDELYGFRNDLTLFQLELERQEERGDDDEGENTEFRKILENGKPLQIHDGLDLDDKPKQEGTGNASEHHGSSARGAEITSENADQAHKNAFSFVQQNLGSAFASLDADGIRYLRYYEEKYCEFISIGTAKLNHFLKTFLRTAARSEPVMFALTAWGGFWLHLRRSISDFSRPWEYMQKAAKAMCARMGEALQPGNKDELFELLSFYLIFIGIEVCTGDVRNWLGFSTQCYHLIKQQGGPIAVLKLFANSTHIRWLLLDFMFHETLSSTALLNGTYFSMQEYGQVLAADDVYGIDPLMGLTVPVYLLLGEIANATVDMRRRWIPVKDAVDREDQDIDILRRGYHSHAQKVFDTLWKKLDECQPSAVHTAILQGKNDELRMHTALFDLYIVVGRIQVLMLILRVSPASVQQQALLIRGTELIDSLLATQAKVSLSLAMLMCGILCCTNYDRQAMTRRFRQHSRQYEIGNLQRIEETVLEVWEVNPAGDACIDWAAMVSDKGWSLYVG